MSRREDRLDYLDYWRYRRGRHGYYYIGQEYDNDCADGVFLRAISIVGGVCFLLFVTIPCWAGLFLLATK